MTLASDHYAWGARAARGVRYVRSIALGPDIPEAERAKLSKVGERYAFHANDYYLGLIDWQDPKDPIRQLIIPREEELAKWGSLDASRESLVTVARSVQHKCPDTVLLLCNEVCGAFCCYCLRKRLFMTGNDEVSLDVSEGLRYIADNPTVSDVLLTGGDPLLMGTRRLVEIFEALRAIPHVRIIRIESKMPAFDPWRILRDEDLQEALRTHSTPRRRIYLMAHFDHPRELTDVAVAGIDCFIRNGVTCVNQCPLIAGVNDDPEVLTELFQRLAWAGVPALLPLPGPADSRQRAVRGADRARLAHLRGGSAARLRAGPASPIRDVSRVWQDRGSRRGRSPHLHALSPGQGQSQRREALDLRAERRGLLAG